MSKENLSKLIPNAIALVMGIVSIILPYLGNSIGSVISFLAIGILALEFSGLQNK